MNAYLSSDAKRAMVLAKEVAKEYGLGYVGTEHLLLAISRVSGSCGSELLRECGANEYNIKGEVDQLVEGRLQDTWVMGRLPGTPHFRDVVNAAAEAARGSGNWQVGTEHLVLAVAAERDSTGGKALTALGVTPEGLRTTLRSQRQA